MTLHTLLSQKVTDIVINEIILITIVNGIIIGNNSRLLLVMLSVIILVL